jgi:CRISPR-associated endonuclease Cas2
MPKHTRKKLTIQERLKLWSESGILVPSSLAKPEDSFEERLNKMLGIIKKKPIKAINMNYFILYDIQNNKVRTQISKYLEQNECIRVQKSVFIANSSHKKFDEIWNTLQEINSYYENQDSIILIPINVSDMRSMKLIGQNIDIKVIVDPPNTLFF